MQALIGLLRTMRPKQWIKNVLFVFPAIIFDRQLTNSDSLVRVIFACVLLILMSGTVYIINDLVDIEKDRQHPKKKNRPLPAGQLPKTLAQVAAVILPTATLIAAWFFDKELSLVLAIYLIIQIAYSFWLKNVVIIDVLTVTSGFLLRVLAGVVVIDVANFSPWLYACSGLLALFLAVGKRRQELMTLGEQALQTRPIFKEYNLALIDDMMRLVTTSTFIAYLLYTIEADIGSFRGTKLALLTVPFVLYGLYRYLYLMHVKGEGSAPDEVLLRDRPLQLAMVGWGLSFIILLYLLPVGS
ncbi:MAG: decaprenyl-phosphate phosphoribosyltransferase [Anaerolineae bacterium]|nr:decaprenyl-phosphate phosphoribosyltransferase [Anaerolineae bacterium]